MWLEMQHLCISAQCFKCHRIQKKASVGSKYRGSKATLFHHELCKKSSHSSPFCCVLNYFHNRNHLQLALHELITNWDFKTAWGKSQLLFFGTGWSVTGSWHNPNFLGCPAEPLCWGQLPIVVMWSWVPQVALTQFIQAEIIPGYYFWTPALVTPECEHSHGSDTKSLAAFLTCRLCCSILKTLLTCTQSKKEFVSWFYFQSRHWGGATDPKEK